MSESTINLLLQIPLAGVVVFVVFIFLKDRREERAARDQQLKEMLAAFISNQKEETAMFMAAIKEQREQNNKALNEITNGFGELVENINTRLSQMAVTLQRDRDTQPQKRLDGRSAER